MKEFNLEIVTPDGAMYNGPTESVLVRTEEGDVQILAGHVSYMASLGTGRAKVRVGGEDKTAAVSGGFIAVNGNDVRLVAVTFEWSDNIDLERAKSAKARAEEEIKRAEDKKSLDLAKARLMRALTRIDVARG